MKSINNLLLLGDSGTHRRRRSTVADPTPASYITPIGVDLQAIWRVTDMPNVISRQSRPGDHTPRVDSTTVAAKALARVFEAWRLGAEASARLAGVSERTWSRMRSGSWSGRLSQDQLLRASALVGLYKGLHLYFGDDLADAWVSLPNRGPLFEGRSPADVMMAGGLPAIIEARNYVDAVRGGL